MNKWERHSWVGEESMSIDEMLSVWSAAVTKG